MKFGFGEKSISNENILLSSNEQGKLIDFLLFFDSRIMTINESSYNGTIYSDILNYMRNNKYTYKLISRPKNLTVFVTLINFIKLNPDLTVKTLITNLGFVDCTPKKQENIDDILLQIQQYSCTQNMLKEHDIYKLNSGKIEILKSIKYSEEYIDELSDLLSRKFDKCYFINTPIVSKSIKIERERPESFFTQLQETNKLVNSIVSRNKNKFILIDIEKIVDTYDGVHYTKEGHKKIFNKIKESIEL